LRGDSVAALDTRVGAKVPHAVGVLVARLRSGVRETALLAAAHGEVATRKWFEIEERRPDAAVVGLARGDVGKGLALLRAKTLRENPFAHALAPAVVGTLSVRASRDASVDVGIPSAARIVVAG
jgi:hypothetical protein